MRNLILAIAALLVLPASAFAIETGAEAPNFSLMDTEGNTRSLSEFKGKHVVLEWINHDCPFVKKHYNSGNMQGLQSFAKSNDVVWLSIASSAPGKQGHYSPSEWNQMTSSKGAKPTAVLLDPEGVVGKEYGAKTTPHMYIITPEGKLVYQGAIDSNPSMDPDDIPESLNYVSKGLKESMAGQPLSYGSTKAYGCSVKYKN